MTRTGRPARVRIRGELARGWRTRPVPLRGRAGRKWRAGALAEGGDERELSLAELTGGQPSSYSETSGVQDTAPFSSIGPSDPPGTFASFETPPLPANLDSVGIPVLRFDLSGPTATGATGATPAAEATVFTKIYDVAPNGSVVLVDRIVSPGAHRPDGDNHPHVAGSGAPLPEGRPHRVGDRGDRPGVHGLAARRRPHRVDLACATRSPPTAGRPAVRGGGRRPPATGA